MLLQKQPRTGWVYNGVDKPESIADHMYRMAILAMTMAGTEYDQSKLVKMAIVHDLAEAIVGDITPADGVCEEDKHSRELAALREIQTMIGAETAVAQEFGQLWCVLVALHECRFLSPRVAHIDHAVHARYCDVSPEKLPLVRAG